MRRSGGRTLSRKAIMGLKAISDGTRDYLLHFCTGHSHILTPPNIKPAIVHRQASNKSSYSATSLT